MQQLHLLGDFNARNTVWYEHAKQKTKLGAILEDIQEPSLYIATDIDHTYHHSVSCEQSCKSAIDLTLGQGVCKA